MKETIAMSDKHVVGARLDRQNARLTSGAAAVDAAGVAESRISEFIFP